MSGRTILIAVGGSGRHIADQIESRLTDGSQPLTRLTLDIESSGPTDHHFSLGGFQLAPVVDKLGHWVIDSDRLDALRDQSRSVDMGAGANPDIGRLALEFHVDNLRNWLLDHLDKAAHSPEGLGNVVVVGSLCGGTGGGVIPHLGWILRSLLDDLQVEGMLHGFGIAPSFLPHWLGTPSSALRDANHAYAVNLLATRYASVYDDFKVVDWRGPTGSSEPLSTLAEHIFLGLIAPQGHSAAAVDGLELLALSEFDGLDLSVFWTTGIQLLNAPGSSQRTPADLAVRISAFRFRWSRQIDAFRTLVYDPNVREKNIQHFLEENPLFLTGFDYHRAVPHVYLHGSLRRDLVPDFMLVPFDGELADILELKLPRHHVIRNPHRHPSFGQNVISAIAQLRAYQEFFDDPKNRNIVAKKYGFTAYKPNLTVVIGTRASAHSDLVFRRVSAGHPGINVLTYDDIISRATRWLR
jgi:Tubulin like/Domain of unknown function (DUF4263)